MESGGKGGTATSAPSTSTSGSFARSSATASPSPRCGGSATGWADSDMRRRLTVAILAVVIGTLVLTVVGSLLLVRRAAISTAENELTTEAEAIGGLMSSYPQFTTQGVV